MSELLSEHIFCIKSLLLEEEISLNYPNEYFRDFCSQSLILSVICVERYGLES